MMEPYRTVDWAQCTPIHELFGLRHDDVFCPHITSVTVLQGPNLLQANPRGLATFTTKDGASLSGRGTGVCIALHTEDNQRRFLLLQFHKGGVFAQLTDPQPSEVPPDKDGNILFEELWRD